MKIYLWILAPLVCAQSFEVASIKLHPGEVTFSSDPMVRGSRVVATASTLIDLITSAYDMRHDQVVGGLKWMNEDHFDLDAKLPDGASATRDEVRAMLRALLAERFQLRLRRDLRQVPVYALMVDNSGSKMKSSALDAPPGGFTRATEQGIHREVTKGTMEELAQQLSVTAGRPVIDKTGLNGFYAYSLDWFPANRLPPSDSNVPSMFVAVREQLGLRLVEETGLQEFLTIEHVEKPSAN